MCDISTFPHKIITNYDYSVPLWLGMAKAASPEQLRVHEGNEILQQFESGADEEVGPEGPEKGPQERRAPPFVWTAEPPPPPDWRSRGWVQRRVCLLKHGLLLHARLTAQKNRTAALLKLK